MSRDVGLLVLRVGVGLMMAHSVRAGREVAQLMYDVAGGTASSMISRATLEICPANAGL